MPASNHPTEPLIRSNEMPSHKRNIASEIPLNPQQKRLNRVALAFGTSLVFSVVIGSYRGRFELEVLSFFIEDGWCRSSTEGIGRHCFGDFYFPLHLSSLEAPWSDPRNPYTPFAHVFFSFFRFVASLLGSRASLMLYLCLSALSVVKAVGILNRAYYKSHHIYSLLMLSAILSVPVLQLLDRGNSLAFSLPAVAYGLVGITKGKASRTSSTSRLVFTRLLRPVPEPTKHLWILVGCALRPQVLLIVVLLSIAQALTSEERVQNVVRTARNTLLAGFLCVSPIFLYGGLGSVRPWINNLTTFSSYQPLDTAFPTNLSMSRAIYNISRSVSNIDLSGREDLLQTLAVSVYFLSATIMLIRAHRHHAKPTVAFTVQIMISGLVLAPGVSFGYYSIFALFGLFALCGQTRRLSIHEHILMTGLFLLCVPFSAISTSTSGLVTQQLGSIILSCTAFLILFILPARKSLTS